MSGPAGDGAREARAPGAAPRPPSVAAGGARDLLLPLLLLAALAAFVGRQALRAPAGRVTPPPAADAPAPSRDAPDAAARRERRLAATRRLLRERAAGTYLPALAAADSLLRRWPHAPARPLRVWVQPASSLRDWYPGHVAAARAAFDAWGRHLPLRLAFTDDSAAAEIRVGWADRLPREQQVGNNRLTWDTDGTIVAAEVTLAVHDTRGQPLPPHALHAVALHEVGHALGLAHSPEPADVMAARWDGGTRGLSARDAATARALYGH